MASGGYEQDFGTTTTDRITPGEKITLRWAVQDSAGTAVTSFATWTAKLFILNSRGVANGLTQLEAGSLLEVDPSLAVPNIDAIITAANWATLSSTMKARIYYYELWRTDAGNETRLAYGKIEARD